MNFHVRELVKKLFQIRSESRLHLWMHVRFRLLNKEKRHTCNTTFLNILGKCSKEELHFDQIFVSKAIVRTRQTFVCCAGYIR